MNHLAYLKNIQNQYRWMQQAVNGIQSAGELY